MNNDWCVDARSIEYCPGCSQSYPQLERLDLANYEPRTLVCAACGLQQRDGSYDRPKRPLYPLVGPFETTWAREDYDELYHIFNNNGVVCVYCSTYEQARELTTFLNNEKEGN